MKQSDTLERLIRAQRNVKWASGDVTSNWTELDRAVRSGRKAIPIAIAPLTFGLFPLIAKASVLALAVGVSAGATVWAYEATENPAASMPIASATRSAVASHAPRVPSARDDIAEQEPPAGEAALAVTEPAGPPGAPRASASAEATRAFEQDSIEEELALLRHAKQQLDRGDFGGAHTDLREHARRFPSGIVADERHALELLVECSVAKGTAPQSRVEHFISTHPRSIHRAAIARACGVPLRQRAPAPTAPQPTSNSSHAPTQGASEPPTGTFPNAE